MSSTWLLLALALLATPASAGSAACTAVDHDHAAWTAILRGAVALAVLSGVCARRATPVAAERATVDAA